MPALSLTARCVLFLIPIACAAQNTPTFQSDSILVTVAVSASGKDGRPVGGLRQGDFVLLDNGSPRAIRYMWREDDTPLVVGLIEDISGSQRGFIEQHRSALEQFIRQVLRPQDSTFLVGVNTDVRLYADYTSSVADLKKGIDNLGRPRGVKLGLSCREEGMIRGCGGTALWNSVYFAARLKMNGISGRKALIVLTDGDDTGSPHNLNEAIKAAQAADTLVYTVRYSGRPPATVWAPKQDSVSSGRARRNLDRLALETGGRAFEASKEQPAAIFAQIEEQLRNLYVLGFTLSGAEEDGAFHGIEVKSTRHGVAVRARKGYTALPR